MSHRLRLLALAALVSAFGSLSIDSEANAALVTLTLSGQIDSITATSPEDADDTDAFKAVLPFEIGDSISTVITWDTSILPISTGAAFGRYDSGTTRLQLGNTVFETGHFIDVIDNLNGRDELRNLMSGGVLGGAAGWSYEGSVQFLYGTRFTDFSGQAFETTQLPTSISISDFDRVQFNLTSDSIGGPGTITTPLGQHVGNRHSIIGNYNSLTIVTAIPEPSSLFALSLVSLLVAARRRRRTSVPLHRSSP